jgi:hypothetical protein
LETPRWKPKKRVGDSAISTYGALGAGTPIPGGDSSLLSVP